MLLVTIEIVLTIVLPLLLLYHRSRWSLRVIVPCLLSIPVLWYFTYAPLHELSHVAATYLAGGTVTSMKLIPSFWLGQFGHAWIHSTGISESWQIVTTSISPYILDVILLVIGIAVLRPAFSTKAFVVGFLFMLLCLRSAFDFLCETTAFVLGDRGDLYHIEQVVGATLIWSFLLLCFGLALFSTAIVLRRFRRADVSVLDGQKTGRGIGAQARPDLNL